MTSLDSKNDFIFVTQVYNLFYKKIKKLKLKK